jgi:hypothetical protein
MAGLSWTTRPGAAFEQDTDDLRYVANLGLSKSAFYWPLSKNATLYFQKMYETFVISISNS